MRRSVTTFSGLLLALGLPVGAQGVNVAPLKGAAASLHWSAAQFIASDAQGKVYLLRADTLEVYPILKSHELGEPTRLPVSSVSGSLHDAAMSPRGDWALAFGARIHLIVRGEDKELPALEWLPVSVGFVGGEPVVGVTPPRIADVDGDDERETPPLLLRQGHDGWAAEVSEASVRAPGQSLDLNDERANRALLVLDARRPRYYLARQYAYRIELRHIGRAAALEELRVGKGEPVLKAAAESDRRLAAQVKAEGMETTDAASHAFRASDAILALRQGPGGRLYVLVSPAVSGSKSCALDRIEWESRQVERIGLNLACPGRVSMAAGKDGLYFAGFNGEDGRYFAPWAELEGAKWKSVKEAKFVP